MTSYILEAGAHTFTWVASCKFLCHILVLQSEIFSPSVTRLNSAMTQFNQVLDLSVLRAVVHRAGDTMFPWGEQIKGSPVHTNTMQLQKHLAAVLDVKERGCWKQGQETNAGVATSSQLMLFINSVVLTKGLRNNIFSSLLSDLNICSCRYCP